MKKICIIDYKINNISSIKKAIQISGYNFDVIDGGEKLHNYSHIILPGVGSFDAGVRQLKKLNLFDLLIKRMDKTYIFGICLGMQLLFEESEESKDKTLGLGIIKGSVKKIISDKKNNIYIPHIGWNNIYSKKNKKLFKIEEKKDFYFANSYHAMPQDKSLIEYFFFHGNEYPAIIKKDNIYAAQFHPEKSDEGIEIINNFLSLK